VIKSVEFDILATLQRPLIVATRKGADFAESIDDGVRFSGEHSFRRRVGDGMRKRQTVEPFVVNFFADIIDLCFVRAVDTEQRCRPTIRLQQFADQTH
jgi:hypothetical protein